MLSKRLLARSLASLSSSSSSSSLSLSSAACPYSLSSPSASLRALRPFSSSAHSPLRAPARAPSLADITPDGAAAFEARQKEFRARTAAAQRAKEEQESQSARQGDVATAGAASAGAGAVGAKNDDDASAASVAVPVGADTTPPPTPFSSFRMGLGSLTTDTAEAQDERAADSAAGTAAGSGSGSSEGDGGGGRGATSKAKGALSSLIYGTKEGRQMDREIERSYSQVLARGKYVHSIVFHRVKPDKVDEYVELVGGWYPRMASMKENKVNLVGSWRTDVGDCDTFVHIWEYQRYQGYHASRHSIASHPEFPAFDAQLRALLLGRDTSLMQEFSFWPTTAPRRLGGVFELRSYTLRPGNLLEWESYWRRGLAARRDVMEGVGAWFVQIGELNTVHHLWQFADLEERKLRRERSWGQEGWSETVHRTVPLIQTMKSRILIPMPWSPVA